MKSLATKMRAALVAGAACLVLASATPPAAAAIKLGVLQCTIAPGVGLIVVSSKSISCTFDPDSGTNEVYTGRITKVGVDIGITGRAVVVWAVFAAQAGYQPGSLAGTYVGASASASVAFGVGANALIGGSGRSIALQPLSVQAQTGLNLAAGVAGLTLTKR